MAKHKITWVNCRLPSGREFAVAVCGYAGRVCHLTLGNDPLSRQLINRVFVEGGQCLSGGHCLALDCALNRAEQMHLLHMLEMFQDEPVDPATAELWGTDSALESLLKFTRQMNEVLPAELRQPSAPEPEEAGDDGGQSAIGGLFS